MAATGDLPVGTILMEPGAYNRLALGDMSNHYQREEQSIQNVAKKILAVMSEIQNVEKNGRNDFHKYSYVTEADILTAIRGSLVTHQLVILPRVVSAQHVDNLTTLFMEFQIVDAENGESITSPFIGTGEDKGDKGAYKALTGAQKYFLMKTFLIPTGDDPEADSATDKRSAEKPTKTTTRKAPAAAASSANFACEECGQVIEDKMKRDGTMWPASGIAEMTSRANNGVTLCLDCHNRANPR